MNFNTFQPLFRLDESSLHYFSVLGRALYAAQHLEMNCRAIAGFLRMREEHVKLGDSILTDESFLKEISKLWKNTLGANNKLLQKINVLSGDISTTFDEAVNARNEIAHDVAMSVDDKIDSELDERLSHIFELVRKIAAADLIASIFILILNNEPLPQNDFTASYIDSVVNWVGLVEK